MVRFIGDVHGKLEKYKAICSQVEKSVQVGDMGAGFVPLLEPNMNHLWIRGNHDDPTICRSRPDCIKDGTIKDNILYIGGARSIDQHLRIEGVSWWRDEELSIKEWDNILQKIMQADCKPKIVVTHDCPEFIVNEMLTEQGKACVYENNRTRQALESIYSNLIHLPKYWIFGHWHRRWESVMHGTKFICLGELDYIDIEV